MSMEPETSITKVITTGRRLAASTTRPRTLKRSMRYAGPWVKGDGAPSARTAKSPRDGGASP